jgi:hypothetical protein
MIPIFVARLPGNVSLGNILSKHGEDKENAAHE